MNLGAMAIKDYSAFPKAPRITGDSPSDYFLSYPGHSLGESYPSAEMQSVYILLSQPIGPMKIRGFLLRLTSVTNQVPTGNYTFLTAYSLLLYRPAKPANIVNIIVETSVA